MTAYQDRTQAGMRPHLRMLSQAQLQQLHDAALQILERTGVQVHLPAAVALLDGAGAWVEGHNRVRIPGHVVESALQCLPHRIQIYDRNGQPAMALEGFNSHYGPGPTIQYVQDVYTAERRSTDKADIQRAAILCDYLPHIDFVMTLGMTGGVNPASQGLLPAVTDRYDWTTMLTHTTKPIIFSAWSRRGVADIIEMAAAVRGNEAELQRRPFMILFSQPISPLVHDEEPLRMLLLCAQKKLPLVYSSAPLMGGTAPNTIAGSMAQSMAEWLSGMTIAQLAQKGAPMIFGAGYGPMDMRNGTSPYNGPEYYLNKLIAKEMANFYGVPDWSYGGVTDAKCLDTQAATEASLSLMLATQVGSNLIHDLGYMEMGMTASLELIVLANELIDSFQHYFRPLQIDTDTLALDLIDRIGPAGNFLSEDHTVDHIKDLWMPNLIDRSDFNMWQANGSLPLEKKLNERAIWILENHTPEPLEAGVQEVINGVIERAERNYRMEQNSPI